MNNNILDMAARLRAGTQSATTDQVKAPNIDFRSSESTVNEPIPDGPLGQQSVAVSLTASEAALLIKYRNSQLASSTLDNADAVMGRLPFWGMINSIIGRVIPKGYGTYTSAIALILVSVASALGYPVPFIEIPENLSGVTGIVGAIFWFMRRARP